VRAAAALGALLVVSASCSGDDAGGHARRRSVERPPVVDYSGAELAHVPGTTTTAAAPEVGSAALVGAVSGPGGLVVGAIVHVEHLVGSTAIGHDVVTGPDGRYAIPAIPGGRYRIRAFFPPALAVAAPDVRFVPDGKETSVDLAMVDVRKVVAKAAISPTAPYLDDPINLSVVVATQTVDLDGIVRSRPVSGLRVELDGLGVWSLRSDDLPSPLQPRITTTTFAPPTPVQYTDGAGTARFELECTSPGDPGLGLLVTVTVTPTAAAGQPPPAPEQRTDRLPLELPGCVDPTTATTPTATVDPVRPTTTTAEPADR
jgi:hypothetical protein